MIGMGWHQMPYLDQGEFYSEFGSYDVSITLPEDYVVGATGNLVTEEERIWLENKAIGINTVRSSAAEAGKKQSGIPKKIFMTLPGLQIKHIRLQKGKSVFQMGTRLQPGQCTLKVSQVCGTMPLNISMML